MGRQVITIMVENFVARAPGTDILFLHSPQTVRFVPQPPSPTNAYFACCASKITAGQNTIYHSYAGKRSRFSCGKDGGSYPKKQSAPSRPLHNSVIITCRPILLCLNRYNKMIKSQLLYVTIVLHTALRISLKWGRGRLAKLVTASRCIAAPPIEYLLLLV